MTENSLLDRKLNITTSKVVNQPMMEYFKNDLLVETSYRLPSITNECFLNPSSAINEKNDPFIAAGTLVLLMDVNGLACWSVKWR